MKGSFFEYNVARSALFTAQANIQIASNNIANAGTKGYSRQYGVTVQSDPLRGSGTGMYGTGSEVATVSRYRNQFLDQKYWTQNSSLSRYESQTTHIESIERMFTTINTEGVDNHILNSFEDLESAFSDLATSANDATYRGNVASSASELAATINSIGEQLAQEQTSLNEEIALSVNQMNSIAKQIARLNEQIKQAEFRGDVANGLRDQRELLIDELSTYVNVEVKETQVNPEYDPTDPNTDNPIYEYKVLINGQLFVDDDMVNELQLQNRDQQDPPIKNNPYDVDGLYDISIGSKSTKFNIYSDSLNGKLRSLIDLRDGNNARGVDDDPTSDFVTDEYGDKFYETSNYKGIPHYMDRLNELARTFARAMNEGENHEGEALDGVVGHVDGYDLEGNTGTYFFTLYDDDGNAINNLTDLSDAGLADSSDLYSNINWKTFAVNEEITSDPNKIATSSVSGTGESDNRVSLGVANIMDNPDLFASGKLNDFVIGISSEIAVSGKQATSFSDRYTDIVSAAENQRLSVSGVDLNEESVELAKFQQMFQAASKMISIIDEIYDTTINRLI